MVRQFVPRVHGIRKKEAVKKKRYSAPRFRTLNHLQLHPSSASRKTRRLFLLKSHVRGDALFSFVAEVVTPVEFWCYTVLTSVPRPAAPLAQGCTPGHDDKENPPDSCSWDEALTADVTRMICVMNSI